MMNRRNLLALLPAACLAPSTMAGYTSPSWRHTRAALAELVSTRNIPGAALGVCFGDGRPVYLSAGTLAFDSETRFDEHSICRIYSMTKNVTRIATLLLAEDGRLSLDQPVTTVLPEFAKLRVAIDMSKGLDSRPAKKVMTMRHLITNTSGLGNWTPSSDSGDELHKLYRERGITPGNYGAGRLRPGYGEQPASLEEMVRRVAELPLAFEPGTVLHYSIGFDVMALVIERVTGIPYGRFLEQRLWQPLDMSSTGFQVAKKDAARLTTNYDATQGPELRVTDPAASSEWLAPPRLLAGGAGLVSTARDFLRYTRMLMNDGALGESRVMKVETARLATGNINPPGIAEPSETSGTGTRALLRASIIPPGTVGGGGAAGTLFWFDRDRRGAVVFMAQAMYGAPARSPFQKMLFPAMEQDLAAA